MSDDASGSAGAVEERAPTEVVRLWPHGPPRSIPGVGVEIAFHGPDPSGSDSAMLRNVTDPSLSVFRPNPANANGTGVIVCPGGAWRLLAWTHEGVDLARWLAGRGYTAFLLKYRLTATPPDPLEFAAIMAEMTARTAVETPALKAPRSLAEMLGDEETLNARKIAADDGRRALEIIRARASEWGVKRVGMIGFSAGAFLTIDVAMTPGRAPLAFAAAIYGGETGGQPIPADAPPLFAAVAEDDRLLFRLVQGLYADWSDADHRVELHVFDRGGHGFGMVRRGLPVDNWVDLLGAWLADQGLARSPLSLLGRDP